MSNYETCVSGCPKCLTDENGGHETNCPRLRPDGSLCPIDAAGDIITNPGPADPGVSH